ncbi:methyltransferase [Streptomyces sp. NPDC002668]|uniref:methyltransferase n=1 Tax=Streptomyces sp. NPDC002668 TaxID=3154422 RepID=UPI003330BCE5
MDENVSLVPLVDLTSGFWAFKTLASSVEMGLFTRLADGRSATLAKLSSELGIEERPARLLLAGCASLGLLEKDGGLYRNSALSEEYLVEGRPYYFGDAVSYCDEREYIPWHRLGDALRENRPVTWDPDTQGTPFAVEDPIMTGMFWKAMHSVSRATARVLAENYDFGPHRRVLDVGGGLGAYLIELCQRHPHLRGTLYDLPHVCPMAREKIAAAGLEETVGTVPGDFFQDAALPDDHDMILLSMILHDWDEDTNRTLLKKCYDALPVGGVVLVSEMLLNPERTGPPVAALMGLNMLVETEHGENYSEDEYVTWLQDAGFTDIQIIRFSSAGANGAVIGRRG